MKVEFGENDGCFFVNLQAENMTEAAALTRFGMNRTDEIRTCYTDVMQAGEFHTAIVIGKTKRASSIVPKRK